MLRKRFHISAAYKFFVVIYVLTFLVMLPLICKDWLFSAYRSSLWTKDVLQNRVLSDNSAAVKVAEEYLISANPENKNTTQLEAELVIAIVTVRRFRAAQPLGYLTRVATAFHRLLRDMLPIQDRFLFICNTHAGPGPHEEADNLKKHFLSFEKFPNGSIEASIINPFEKEKQDYIFCLEKALTFSPEFVLMVEDDALPRDEFFPVLQNLVNYFQDPDHIRRQYLRWSYLKFYYPERWQGYSVELQKVSELLGIFAIGTTLSAVCHLCCLQTERRLAARKENWRIAFVGGLYFILLALAIGRQHLFELKRILSSTYSLVSAPECCSPCILYPSVSALRIVHYLKTVRCSHLMPLDIALDRFARIHLLPSYLVEPNVFRHIGFVSTMKGLSDHPEEFLM